MQRERFPSLLKIFTLLVSFFVFYSCADQSATTKPRKSSSIKKVSRGCGVCHQRIYKEWTHTGHAKSAPSKSPVVKAYYDFLSGENLETRKCDQCHVPLRSLYSQEKEQNEKLFEEGVNCLFCHVVRGVRSKKGQGTDYYRFNILKPLTGPSKTIEKIAHDADFIGLYKETDYCLGCHQNGEADYYYQKEDMDVPCQDCHMPSAQNLKSSVSAKVRDTVNRHLFEGGRSREFLSSAVVLSGASRKKEGKIVLEVVLENTAFHAVPTGFPLRAAVLKITGMDKQGNPVWSNYGNDPATEDPGAYFALSYAEEDEVYVHWVKEVKPLKDTRLLPASERKLSYEVASHEITAFQIQIFYRPFPASVIKKLRLDNTPGLEDVLMVEETISVENQS